MAIVNLGKVVAQGRLDELVKGGDTLEKLFMRSVGIKGAGGE
jgi:hypothetical protein